MNDPDARLGHALERTSPKGEPFVGRCVLCGQENLTTANVTEPCPNPEGKTVVEAIIQAIEGVEPDQAKGT